MAGDSSLFFDAASLSGLSLNGNIYTSATKSFSTSV